MIDNRLGMISIPLKVKNESVSCSVMSDSLRLQDCSPPGSSVCGILQARILEWVAIPLSRASSQPRDQTHIFCIESIFFTTESPVDTIALVLFSVRKLRQK